MQAVFDIREGGFKLVAPLRELLLVEIDAVHCGSGNFVDETGPSHEVVFAGKRRKRAVGIVGDSRSVRPLGDKQTGIFLIVVFQLRAVAHVAGQLNPAVEREALLTCKQVVEVVKQFNHLLAIGVEVIYVAMLVGKGKRIAQRGEMVPEHLASEVHNVESVVVASLDVLREHFAPYFQQVFVGVVDSIDCGAESVAL